MLKAPFSSLGLAFVLFGLYLGLLFLPLLGVEVRGLFMTLIVRNSRFKVVKLTRTVKGHFVLLIEVFMPSK